MRTNIVLDDELMQTASRYSEARTKRALVEDALQTFVAVKSEEARRARYRDQLKALEPELEKLEPATSSLDILRRDRQRS